MKGPMKSQPDHDRFRTRAAGNGEMPGTAGGGDAVVMMIPL